MAVPLKKLEDQLNCPICLDTFTNPKQLQCNHVYCQQCLDRLVVQDQQGQFTLTCPNCRQVTPVPASGLASLQAAFRVTRFLEIVEEHKRVAEASEEVESALTSLTGHDRISVVCPEHGGKEVDLYCETCEETICWKCIKKGEKHHNHDYQELVEAFEQYKKQIASALIPLEKQLIAIKKALPAFDARHDELSNQRETIKTDIHKAMTRFHQTLEVRETELISQLDQLTQSKLKSLSAQRDQLETTQAQLNSCLLFLKENLKSSNIGESMMMKSTTVQQVKELTTTSKSDSLEPNSKADMIFSVLSNLESKLKSYGQVLAASSPDPSKCYVTSQDLDVPVGKVSTTCLQVMNFNGLPCKGSVTSISCELVSDILGVSAEGNVERSGQSQYKISYLPRMKGKHQLHIQVEGQRIMGSPFSISARSPVEKLGKLILTLGGLREPTGIAVNQRGEVVVAEGDGSRVAVFNFREDIQYSHRCKVSKPYGIAIDANGNILISDRLNHRIQKFSAHGKFLKAVGFKGSGPLQFDCPLGITLGTVNSKVYVVDSGNSRIEVLNPDLSYFGTFGKAGSGKGQLDHPHHIACDSTGNVYVADTQNHCIKVFTAEGRYLRKQSGLDLPYGVAIDSSDRVYVCEGGSHRVSVFTSEGQLVTSFGSKGEGQGQFNSPHGIAVDNCGVVYICDFKNNCLQLF